jgi:hypothetical protein
MTENWFKLLRDSFRLAGEKVTIKLNGGMRQIGFAK